METRIMRMARLAPALLALVIALMVIASVFSAVGPTIMGAIEPLMNMNKS